MGHSMIDRRADKRCTAAAMRVSLATLRPGRHVRVIDLSPAGALVQTDRPLRPGSRVQIRLVLATITVSVAAHIVRCLVSAIHPEYGVTYRAALRFDERCTRLLDRETSPQPGGIAARPP
jgi:hypothetical protein